MDENIIKVVIANEELDIKLQKPELIYGIEGLLFEEETKEKEAYIPIVNKKVPIIRSDKTRFFIPAHNVEDYEYAIKNKIKINQVVAPYFLGKGNEKIRRDKKTMKRHSVIAIIKHVEQEKYLCIDCKNRKCRSFVLGGIEGNETPEETAIREVKEETGYEDITIIYTSPFKLINHFYAEYKGVNRYATLDIVIGRLNSDRHTQISEEENKKHIVKWIEKDKLKDFLTVNNNIYALNVLLNGDSPILEEGIMINSNNLNDLKSTEARKKVIEMLRSRY